MKQTLKSALIATLPVLTGYLVLGFGFGIILKSEGGSVLLACAAVTLLHLWRNNTLLSIIGGTLTYMLLVQFIFT